MRHVPLTHAPAVFALAHGTAHAPQLFGSLLVSISQPSPASALQFAKPALHAINKHRPALHIALALLTLHVRPHAPQCIGLVVRSCSQPLPAFPSQSPRFAMHVLSQRLFTHVPIEPPKPTHGRSQSPQFIESDRVSTQRPLHRTCPIGHVTTLVSGTDPPPSFAVTPLSATPVSCSIAASMSEPPSRPLSERVITSGLTDSAPTAHAASAEDAHTINNREPIPMKRPCEAITRVSQMRSLRASARSRFAMRPASRTIPAP